MQAYHPSILIGFRFNMKITIPDNKNLHSFHPIVEGWLDGMLSLDIRYIALRSDEEWHLVKAHVTLGPSFFEENRTKEIETEDIRVGLIQENFSKKDILSIVKGLYMGKLTVAHFPYKFPDSERLDYYAPFSEESNYFQYQVSISSQMKDRLMFSHIENKKVNAELRCLPIPFDGLADLFSFMGFQGLNQIPNNVEILLRVDPPVALVLSECSLENNKLQLKLLKQNKYPVAKINVALRLFPHPSFERRSQVGSKVKWQKNSRHETDGTLNIKLEDSATAEVMLSADGHTISRYFVVDKNKSLNQRLTNYTKYDPDLKVLKEKLFCAPKDSRYLETGVASLAYLLGFTTFHPPLDDAPDLILETRKGRVAIVECTTRVTDIRAKAGKLVNRRYLLQNNSNNENFVGDIVAILVVNLPQAQIVNEADYLAQNEVLLITKESLDSALNQLELPSDTDSMFNDAREKLRNGIANKNGF